MPLGIALGKRGAGRHDALVRDIKQLVPGLAQRSEDELDALRDRLKERAANNEPAGLLLPDTYALVGALARRTLDMDPYDVQYLGAIGLHEGKILEMANGEGKTLTATMPVCLASLYGGSVHVATYNDYLAHRDASLMGPLYHAFGLSVGVIQPARLSYRSAVVDGVWTLEPCSRKVAYECDVTYGTHVDFVFDYLRDNMVGREDEIVQRARDYIILDEADSVLLDSATTPMRYTESVYGYSEYYRSAQIVAGRLHQRLDFVMHPLPNRIELTGRGVRQVEQMLGVHPLYSVQHSGIASQVLRSIEALHLFKRDRDYIVHDDRVVLIDGHTGRPNYGSRYSDGVHQAVEAKEGVPITPGSRVMAEIACQRYFKLYRRMAGMTATTKGRREEFREVYGMEVLEVEPRVKPRLEESPPLVYKTRAAKIAAIVEDVVETHATGRPVLIGTPTIEEADDLGGMLAERGIDPQILHAKYHAREAEIIAAAGQKGAVTISAKMAGRGTDILLGEGVADLGGLHVIGTERNDSQHIDQHLRGRAGRQGHRGSAQFYVSLEDSLILRFGGASIAVFMERLGLEEDVPLEHSWVTTSINNAQRKVEGYNRDQRMRSYDLDGAVDKQRRYLYGFRNGVVRGRDLADDVAVMVRNFVARMVQAHMPDARDSTSWRTDLLAGAFAEVSPAFQDRSLAGLRTMKWREASDRLVDELRDGYGERVGQLGSRGMTHLMQRNFLNAVDQAWAEHLRRLDDLQQEKGLRVHVEEDQLHWYTLASSQSFADTLAQIERGYLRTLGYVPIEQEA